ncbi:MAG: DUF1385 domain-containing protein [Armatimonadota bacterium]|nr:DUF1385 domain-containing protein [bacterium]
MNHNSSIAQHIKSIPAVTPSDTVRRAAGLIRASEGTRILVLDGGHIVGTVSERGVAAYLSSADDMETALDSAIAPIVEPGGAFVNIATSLPQVAGVFASTDADVLPVIDDYGSYRGVIYRRDVVGSLTRTLRPPSVGGMATPLGVYLTTGSHTGGAGSFGLFLTGIWLGSMMIAASLIVGGLQSLIMKLTHLPLSAMLASTPIPRMFNLYDLPMYISMALTVIIFLVLLRLSPLAGYHAAEHMTVHAIEAGEALQPEIVSRMPRVHPRCGTNLLAAMSVFTLLVSRASSDVAVLVAIVVVIIGWRTVGGWMQQYITTKTPNQRQLKNGIAAGNEVLDHFQQRPNYQPVGFQRVWNMGFIQTAAGMGAVLTIMSIVQLFVHLPGF